MKNGVYQTQYLCVGGKPGDLQVYKIVSVNFCMEYIYLETKMESTGRTENEIEHQIMKENR